MQWEQEEEDHRLGRRITITVRGDGVRTTWSEPQTFLVGHVSLEEFVEGCGQDRVEESFGAEILKEAIAEAKRLLATRPPAAVSSAAHAESWRRSLTSDRAFEIEHVIEPGPRDDFHGKAEHSWYLVHRPSRYILAWFEGGEHWGHWTGVKDVRFGDEGRTLIVTSVNAADRDISHQRTDEERFALPDPPGYVSLPCVRCGQSACTFTMINFLKRGEGSGADVILYSGVLHPPLLGKSGSWRVDAVYHEQERINDHGKVVVRVRHAEQQEELERIVKTGDAAAIKNVVADVEWQEVKKHDPFFTYGSKRKEHFDAFCVQCQMVYCKDHYRIESRRGPRNNIVTQGTCPKGHVHEMDDGT